MDILGKKKIIVGILGLITIIEIGMVVNTYLTIKYKVEMSQNISNILNTVYSMVNTLSIIIVFDLVILIVLLFLIFKKKRLTL